MYNQVLNNRLYKSVINENLIALQGSSKVLQELKTKQNE